MALITVRWYEQVKQARLENNLLESWIIRDYKNLS